MNHGPLVSGLVDVILHDENEDELPADPKRDLPALKQRVNMVFLLCTFNYLDLKVILANRMSCTVCKGQYFHFDFLY